VLAGSNEVAEAYSTVRAWLVRAQDGVAMAENTRPYQDSAVADRQAPLNVQLIQQLAFAYLNFVTSVIRWLDMR